VCDRLVVRRSTTPCHTRRDQVIDSDSLAESTARMLSESTWSLRMDGWIGRYWTIGTVGLMTWAPVWHTGTTL